MGRRRKVNTVGTGQNCNTTTLGSPMYGIEPYVDADSIAVFLNELRKNVIRLAREGKITCYPASGRERHTYKFKCSEVDRDMQKIRRQGSTL